MKTREIELISRIARALLTRNQPRLLQLGIGDDAALLRASPSKDWVISCDSFLESVHFLLQVHPPKSVGYKALARALSDLAAMGARPRLFLLALALPASRTTSWLNSFLNGMAAAARQSNVALVGGDTSQSRTIAINVTVLGETERGESVLRSGARPGDSIFVTGQLGAAQVGLELLRQGRPPKRRFFRLLERHLYPEPRIAVGRWLASTGAASAMIDTSDGFSTDLTRLCDSSGVGARVRTDRLPVVCIPEDLKDKLPPTRDLALHGGEDYELLFTAPKQWRNRMPPSYRGVKLTLVGAITRERGIRLVETDGSSSRLESRGWDHFRGAAR